MFPLLCLLFHLLGVLIYFSQEVLCKKFSLKYKMQTKKVCKSEMYSSHFCKMITVFYSAPSSKSGASLGPKVPFMRHLMIFTSQIELSLFLSFICPLSFLLKKKKKQIMLFIQYYINTSLCTDRYIEKYAHHINTYGIWGIFSNFILFLIWTMFFINMSVYHLQKNICKQLFK